MIRTHDFTALCRYARQVKGKENGKYKRRFKIFEFVHRRPSQL